LSEIAPHFYKKDDFVEDTKKKKRKENWMDAWRRCSKLVLVVYRINN
jgi:hypothetical protein